MSLANFVKGIVKNGQCCFSLDYAQRMLQKSRKAILSSIEHLSAKGELVSPAKGFYVIVFPEYSDLGAIPAEYFIPYLMEYWGVKYYACLLTAARYHGASHQAVQVFQVMVEKPRPPIVCGKVKVNFITNRHLSGTPVQTISTSKSILIISTPEGTAMDLLKFPNQSGGIDHITTVLAELNESISSTKLAELANKQTGLLWKQRLGYLLDFVGAKKLANVLKINIDRQKRVVYVPMLLGEKNVDNYSKNHKWKIIENTKIESDL